jgi:deazaflavin-dependent oxidoreductase (nitroreductase family)
MGERDARKERKEPWTVVLHPFARSLRRPQQALVGALRGGFEHAPHWVLLTTRGRKTGLPREVMLPCARTRHGAIVISTYGWRAQWLRNLEADPHVRFSAGGRVREGLAEIVDDPERKRRIVERHPFFPIAPFAFAQALSRGVLRRPTVAWLQSWVAARPVVVIRAA